MKLAKIFSDGMVLQRNKPIKVFGSGAGNVEVSFLGDKVSLSTEKMKWMLELPEHDAGGPYTMTVDEQTNNKLGINVSIAHSWISEVKDWLNIVWKKHE